MNRQAKSAIKTIVLTLRHKLEDDIAIQLKRYGFAGERWLPLERLPHIQRDDQATIDHFRLKAALEQHLRRIGADPEKATSQQRAEAVDWFVREVAFSHLNRLVALKCLEVRGLIPEIITTREAYGGRSRAHYDYRNAHPDEARRPDDALPAAIRHVCRQVYAEFKFLFDVGDPATGHPPPANSILWPSYPIFKECIAFINGLDEAAGNDGRTLWAEDEIIGWIYQFYNAEQKEAIRKRGRPRRPAEVAVINQFFTPRWIVKFLVDNTLGRLWLEMHPDSEQVRAKCDYLVPEPLGADEIGNQGDRGFRLAPDSPINNPKAPPRREPKRPQDIRLIDPACGTMHFGHYAFEVFQEIYRDANEHGWHHLPSPSQGEGPGMGVEPGEGVVPEDEIPAMILRHNLYGVDIDLRAVQLAGLSLFIKAKLALSQAEGTANPNAHISHLNLVVADAVLPADGARQRFLDQYKDDKVVQDAVRQVLDEMANVAEVGSLLRVEERLRDILAKAGHAAVRDLDPRRQKALPGFEEAPRQLSLAELPEAVPEEWGAHYTVARLLGDLRAFAAEAFQTHDLNAQLFAEEAEKSVHLLDVFLNDYDVVVMNPPYGDTTSAAKSYLRSIYPETKNDIYAAFFERAIDLVERAEGLVGALTSKTFMSLPTYQGLRENIILAKAPPRVLLDLGFNVLDDAIVDTAATALSIYGQTKGVFVRLWQFDPELREDRFRNALYNLNAAYFYKVDPRSFSNLPKSPFSYWASEKLISLVHELTPLDRDVADSKGALKIADVKDGLSAGGFDRFVRHFWECNPELIGRGKKWVPFAKGGNFCRYYSDLYLVVDWESDGAKIRDLKDSRVQNERFYYQQGITYPNVTVKGYSARHLPHGAIFSTAGQAVIPTDESLIFPLLAFLNSKLAEGLLSVIGVKRHYNVGFVANLPVAEGLLKDRRGLSKLSQEAHDLKASWDTGNEICTRFDAPWLIQAHRGTLLADSRPQGSDLTSLLDYVRDVETAADARLQELQAQIDEAIYDLYEISPEDRALIERELGDRPPELIWPQMEGKSDQEKRREHVRRLISYFLLQALKEKRDGILPLTPGAGQTTALDEVRRRMEAEFGEEAAFKMETDIKRVLGKSIADWLDGPFFKWHVKLYKRRPVIWHLASPRNLFGCFAYLHKLDRDTLRKVQTLYLWPRRRAAEAELEAAQRAKAAGEPGAARRIDQAEALLDDLAEFEKRLLAVIQGQVACDIPGWAEGPYRGGVYDPTLDDGVKVNITPLQEAGVLRYRKVV
jgi:hypothetical protein